MIPHRSSIFSNEVLIAPSPERRSPFASTPGLMHSSGNPKRIRTMQLDSPRPDRPVWDTSRPETFEENLSELQKRFPDINRGSKSVSFKSLKKIASSILETCNNSVADASISLRQLANASSGPVPTSRAGKRRLESDDEDDEGCTTVEQPLASSSDLSTSVKSGTKRGHDAMVSEHADLTGEQWAERLVLHLQGSPSLAIAKQRACEVLEAYERCVRERAAAESAGSKQEVEELQKKLHRHKTANKVLYRALHILNSRTNHCQDQAGSFGTGTEEPAVVEELRKKLEEAEAALRREKQTTDVLRYHLQQATSLNCVHLGGNGFGRGGGGIY